MSAAKAVAGLIAAAAAVLAVRRLRGAAGVTGIGEEQEHAASSLFWSLDQRRDG